MWYQIICETINELSVSLDEPKEICWRDTWIHPFESVLSVIEKVKLANHVDSSGVIRTLGNEKVRIQKTLTQSEKNLDLYSMEVFDVQLFKQYTSFDIQKQRNFMKAVCKSRIFAYKLHDNFSKYFRYCELCMENSFHSILHQFVPIHKCPFHNIDLQDTCIKCNKWRFYKFRFSDHYRCFCGYRNIETTSPVWKSWGNELTFDNVYFRWQFGDLIQLLL